MTAHTDADPVLILVGPSGRRPREALLRCVAEVLHMRRLLEDAGTRTSLALALPPDVVADAGLESGGSVHVFPRHLSASSDDSLEESSAVGAWLAALPRHGSVHAVGCRAAVSAVAARRHTGAPVVAQVDVVPSWPGDGGFHSSRPAQLGWLALAACDAVLVESVWAQDVAVASGVQPTRVAVTHPGVEVGSMCPAPRASDDGTLRVLSVGSASDVMAIRALTEAARHVPGCELVVGRVTGLDPTFAEHLRAALARDLVTQRLGDRLSVVTEPVDAMCADVDVVADVSATPGRGLGVLAGMAAARAVVATDVGGIGELVVHRTTGLLVPVGSPLRARDAVLELLRDPFHREAYGEAGSDRVQAIFSPARFLDTVLRAHGAAALVGAGAERSA